MRPLHDGHPRSPVSPRDLDVYRTLARHHGGNLGVWTTVLRGGSIAERDVADVVDPPADRST